MSDQSRETPRPQLVTFDPHARSLGEATMMIVDDEPLNVKVLRKYLKEAGYTNIVTTTDSREAMALAREHDPDVVLLDVMMPHVDGLSILEMIRKDGLLRFTPVIIVTASSDERTKDRALDLGATDFLAKPVDANDLLPRVRNALTVRAYQQHLENYSARLEREVQSRTATLEKSRLHVIHCLARAAEYRDDNTGQHVIRVGLYAGAVARRLGIPDEQAVLIEQAAQLHDVGKIGIPDQILHKPGKLTDEEFELMTHHCEMGRDIIVGKSASESGVPSSDGRWTAMIAEVLDSPVLALAAVVAMTHHEKWNGTGYPLGLSGETIPVEGRIVAVADVYDALSTARPYKEAFSLDKCLAIINEGRGQHFDPAVVDAFSGALDQILEIQSEYGERRGRLGHAA
ncbi:MAG: HD domain-containing phosphohydrolase [Planctomycetota bacterium]|jgi:putative two-component system response regulator